MAIIKCPECGGNVSDTIEACPHCGFKIKPSLNILGNEVSKKEEGNLIVVVRRDRTQGSGIAAALTVIGIVFIVAIIGISLLMVGIADGRLINNNNVVSKELIYFDKEKKVFVIYDVKGRQYICNPRLFKPSIKLRSGIAAKHNVIFRKKNMGLANMNDWQKIDEVIAAL